MTRENPAPTALSALAGEWATEMTHRLLPGTVLHGRSTFELLEGGKFLLQREQVEHPEFPDASLAVIGGADDDDLRMHYFDSRGVVRIFELTIDGRVWSFVRDTADFSPLDFKQRMTWTLSDDGDHVAVLGEICEDGQNWQDDIHVMYRRTAGD